MNKWLLFFLIANLNVLECLERENTRYRMRNI